MSSIIKIELTIRKSGWLDENTLLSGIEEHLAFRLATGGCKIIESRILPQEEEKKEDTRTVEITWGELLDRFGYEKMEEIHLNSWAIRDGRATRETIQDVVYKDAKILGMTDAEFNSRHTAIKVGDIC